MARLALHVDVMREVYRFQFEIEASHNCFCLPLLLKCGSNALMRSSDMKFCVMVYPCTLLACC